MPASWPARSRPPARVVELLELRIFLGAGAGLGEQFLERHELLVERIDRGADRVEMLLQ
jgi:hypothetical protein